MNERTLTRAGTRALSTAALWAALATLLGGCSAVKGIFKAGVWSGVIIAVLFLIVAGFVASMFRRA